MGGETLSSTVQMLSMDIERSVFIQGSSRSFFSNILFTYAESVFSFSSETMPLNWLQFRLYWRMNDWIFDINMNQFLVIIMLRVDQLKDDYIFELSTPIGSIVYITTMCVEDKRKQIKTS